MASKRLHSLLLVVAMSGQIACAGRSTEWPPDAPRLAAAYEVPPKPINMVPVEYPAMARENRQEGSVWIRVAIDRHGAVRKATVEKTEVIDLLNDAALAAARQWTFEPAEENGTPIRCEIIIPFHFNLR